MRAQTSVKSIVFAKIYCFLILPVLIHTAVASLALDWQISLLSLIAIALVLNLIPTIVVYWLSNKVGAAKAKRSTIRDQYRSNITQARYLITIHQYKKALELIEQYLDKDPNSGEALCLKAQILLDGFNDFVGAKLCTNKILQITDNTCSWHQLAMNLQKEIYKKRRLNARKNLN